MGNPCSVCGTEGPPNEVNGQVVSRRQAVASVLATADRHAIETSTFESLFPPEWRSYLSGITERITQSLGRLSRKPNDANARDDAGQAIAELRGFELWLEERAPLRPYVQHQEAIRKAAARLSRMATKYLEAMEAASMSLAQKLGRDAQSEIDAGVSSLNEADSSTELSDRLGAANQGDFVKVALDVLLSTRPGQNIFEIDSEWQEALTARLGRPIADGQGASYAIADLLANSQLDASRFRRVVGEATELFRTHGALGDIASEPSALEYLLKARNAIVESTVAFSATVATSAALSAQLRRAINLYRELFEDGAAPLFAWFLRVANAKGAPISKLMREDSTALLDAVNRTPSLAQMFIGADKGIRTAASHGHSYSLVGDSVQFSTRTYEETLTLDQFVDRLLALTESLLAAFWVLDNELAAVGAKGHTAVTSLIGEPMFAVATLVLEQLGSTVLDSQLGDESWTFTLAPGAKSEPFVYAYVVGAHEQSNIREITILRPDLPSGTLRVSNTACAVYATFKDLEPVHLLASNLAFIEQSKLDGRSAVTQDHVRKTVCAAAVALLQTDDVTAVSVMRQCMKLANALDASDITQFASDVFVEWRTPDKFRARGILERMELWNALPTPGLPPVRSTTIFFGEPVRI